MRAHSSICVNSNSIEPRPSLESHGRGIECDFCLGASAAHFWMGRLTAHRRQSSTAKPHQRCGENPWARIDFDVKDQVLMRTRRASRWGRADTGPCLAAACNLDGAVSQNSSSLQATLRSQPILSSRAGRVDGLLGRNIIKEIGCAWILHQGQQVTSAQDCSIRSSLMQTSCCSTNDSPLHCTQLKQKKEMDVHDHFDSKPTSARRGAFFSTMASRKQLRRRSRPSRSVSSANYSCMGYALLPLSYNHGGRLNVLAMCSLIALLLLVPVCQGAACFKSAGCILAIT